MPHYRLHRDPLSSHQQIAQLLRRLRPTLTLDVGAAQGFLGQLLQGSGLAIDAVEPQPEWAELAEPFYRRIYSSTIEDAHLPENTYDAIVCADVLEHLSNPLEAMQQLRRVATGNAAFVISLPNVAHVAVRLMLLAGRFPKMDRGILDRTHLHFFTRDTAQDLLHEAGLRIEETSASGVPLEEIWRGGEGRALFRVMSRLQHGCVRVAPTLFGFQFIFLARPARP